MKFLFILQQCYLHSSRLCLSLQIKTEPIFLVISKPLSPCLALFKINNGFAQELISSNCGLILGSHQLSYSLYAALGLARQDSKCVHMLIEITAIKL